MENNGLIYGKISKIMADCPAIGKNQRNQQQGFSYRGIDDVMNGLQNLLPKYGVFYVPEVIESQREERQTARGGNLIYTVLKVKYTFYAEDGSHVTAVVQSEGMDSADKSSNKAMSAACKYALFQVFNIPTVEMVDPDAESHDSSLPVAKAAPVAQKTQAPAQQTVQIPAENKLFYPGDETFLQTFKMPDNFSTNLTLAAAKAMQDNRGMAYDEKSLEQLYYTLTTVLKRYDMAEATEKAELKKKVDAIYLIINARKYGAAK